MSTASEKAFANVARILEHGVDAAPVSARARPVVTQALDWLHAQKGFTISRRESQERGGWGPTRQINLEESGELESFLDGTMRRITIASFCRRLIAAALMSYPVDGPERRARLPVKRYAKRARPRTPAELEGLRKGNEGRAFEAARKREAKITVRV